MRFRQIPASIIACVCAPSRRVVAVSSFLCVNAVQWSRRNHHHHPNRCNRCPLALHRMRRKMKTLKSHLTVRPIRTIRVKRFAEPLNWLINKRKKFEVSHLECILFLTDFRWAAWRRCISFYNRRKLLQLIQLFFVLFWNPILDARSDIQAFIFELSATASVVGQIYCDAIQSTMAPKANEHPSNSTRATRNI